MILVQYQYRDKLARRGIVQPLLVLLLMATIVSVPAGGQQPTRDPVMTGWSPHRDVVECFDCHFGGQESNPLRNVSSDGLFSRQHEARIWLQQDKHTIARQRIEPLASREITREQQRVREAYGDDHDGAQWVGPSNALSRQICERLGWDVSTDAGYQQFREQCLTCHAGYVTGSDAQSLDLAGSRRPGIGCNVCHQLGTEKAWVRQHPSAGVWRLLPPDEKAAAGMRPLQSESSQASLCADCHVGNLVQNKFVTHAMFAAGHPPLPNFEFETFCEAMPRHWQMPSELFESLANDPDRQRYFAINYPPFFGDENQAGAGAAVGDHTRAVLLGGIQSRQHWVQLLVAAADSDTWGDYALYDCMACHHELRRDSPRQEFPRDGIPGRPQQWLWTRVLTQVAAEQVKMVGELDAAEQHLGSALDSQPFGERAACRESAQKMMSILDRLRDELSPKPFSGQRVRDVLVALAETPKSQLVDYLSARQVVWSLHQVARDLDAGEPQALLFPTTIAPSWHGMLIQLPGGPHHHIYPNHLIDELQHRALFDPSNLLTELESLSQRLRSN